MASKRAATALRSADLVRDDLESRGEVRAASLPEAVASSWERCVELGLDSAERQRIEGLGARELQDMRERNLQLTEQALPPMA
ncbi:MAG: hypothetical protein EBV57_02015 [Betaproteobacteria bacterium]|nr:hypothetical protein [Betaproteobacteria bacterium]